MSTVLRGVQFFQGYWAAYAAENQTVAVPLSERFIYGEKNDSNYKILFLEASAY